MCVCVTLIRIHVSAKAHDRTNLSGSEAYGEIELCQVNSCSGIHLFRTSLQYLAPNVGHDEILDWLRHPFQSTSKTNEELWYRGLTVPVKVW